ncbi:hypothetical protein A2U01_0037339, partial [Trifolium medium]|nr:hypothetical protein [Trifolium medium]
VWLWRSLAFRSWCCDIWVYFWPAMVLTKGVVIALFGFASSDMVLLSFVVAAAIAIKLLPLMFGSGGRRNVTTPKGAVVVQLLHCISSISLSIEPRWSLSTSLQNISSPRF